MPVPSPSQPQRTAGPRSGSALLLVTVLLSCLACASKGYARRQLAPEGKVEGLAELGERLERTDSRLGELEDRVSENEADLRQIASTAHLAREEADRILGDETGTGASKILLRDDAICFAAASAELDDDARILLDAFVARLLARGQPVYVEIWGHAEPEEGSRLARERARRVERHLHAAGIPAHHMSAISVGSPRRPDSPASGAACAGERRVTLLVVS